MNAQIDVTGIRLETPRLTCAHFETNSQSRRVIEKCGFAFRKPIQYETRMGTVEPSREFVLYNKR